LAEGPRVIRVLVVEDFEPFRRLVCFKLAKRPDLLVIAESSDGLEAVQKAEELQPDLILLDVGLPNLNGLAAARQIRKLAPKARIIFVSQESSADVVLEALNTGAAAYVAKIDLLHLLTAVDAVLDGRQFVSTALLEKL
jgi:DNA-binding NarL/FixJ family response regulator